MLRKNPKFDIKQKYRKIFEISLALSLFLTIVAFKTFPNIESERDFESEVSEIITVFDIPPTGAPPVPPPKPIIPIEAPSDEEELEDIPIDDNDLKVNEDVEPTQPPIIKDDDTNIETIFVAVEEMPTPIGGISAIQKKIIYPEIAKRAGVQGRVTVRAFVDKNGNVFKAEIIKGIGAGCDEEAITAVMKTKFSPGMQRGKPVRVQVSVPILFKLN
ncbi:MAG: energy transducer TonB [Melioribacteraceae bacterium]